MPLPKTPRVVITGAGSGFGRALALVLAERGARLVLGDRDEPTVRETAHLALERGAADARAVRCDVTRLDDIETLAASRGGVVDLVVNNAGVGSGGAVGVAPIEDWRWTLEANLFGVIHGCHVFVPLLLEQGCGHVLNVASAAGLVSAPQMGAYNVSKAGVVALSETLAAELEGTPVGVTVLCPTFFRSNIVRRGRFADDAMRERGMKLIAKGRSAEFVARAALTSIDEGHLYSIPMVDARVLWRLKRLAPETFATLAGKISKRMGRV
jgi:short-subunit dehydrogenase